MEQEMQLIREMRKNGDVIRDKYDVLQKDYPNRFVALYEGKVIDSDTDPKALNSRVEKDVKEPVLVLVQFIPEKGTEILY